jgi:hypothetical protein
MPRAKIIAWNARRPGPPFIVVSTVTTIYALTECYNVELLNRREMAADVWGTPAISLESYPRPNHCLKCAAAMRENSATLLQLNAGPGDKAIFRVWCTSCKNMGPRKPSPAQAVTAWNGQQPMAGSNT